MRRSALIHTVAVLCPSPETRRQADACAALSLKAGVGGVWAGKQVKGPFRRHILVSLHIA
jgi:hypothetical protein